MEGKEWGDGRRGREKRKGRRKIKEERGKPQLSSVCV